MKPPEDSSVQPGLLKNPTPVITPQTEQNPPAFPQVAQTAPPLPRPAPPRRNAVPRNPQLARPAKSHQIDYGFYLERRLAQGDVWWSDDWKQGSALGYSWTWDDSDFVDTWKKCEGPNMPMACRYPQKDRAQMPQYRFD
jgi:hypothetical protein